MKLRTLIIDDEPISLEKLRSYASKIPFIEIVGVCRNGIDAIAKMSETETDLVFTDINMPDMNGLDFIRSLSDPPLVVFITAYAEYAVQSYKLSAVDYLLKPYDFADIQRAANKALQQYSLRTSKGLEDKHKDAKEDIPNCLFIKVDYKYVRVNIDDIRYIKGYGEYLQIFTKGNTAPFLTLSSFNDIKKKLPHQFQQVHRSYVVNMDAIESISKNRIVMDPDTTIPVGDSYKEIFHTYLSNHSIGTASKKHSIR